MNVEVVVMVMMWWLCVIIVGALCYVVGSVMVIIVFVKFLSFVVVCVVHF